MSTDRKCPAKAVLATKSSFNGNRFEILSQIGLIFTTYKHGISSASFSIRFGFTRSYAALRAADLEWIVGPGYSLGGYTLEKHHEKPTWNHETKTLHTRGHK